MVRTVWKITLIGSSCLPIQKMLGEVCELSRLTRNNQQIALL
jgi:hypothetical protein